MFKLVVQLNNFINSQIIRVYCVRSMSSEKKHLHVLIDAELYNTLITLAPELSDKSKYRGAVSQIVEEALRLYFSQRLSPRGGGGESTHTQSTQGRLQATQNKALKAFMEIIDFIRRERNYPEGEIICEIPSSELVRAIMEVKGLDPRTVRKYLDAFQKHKLIAQERREHLTIFRVLVYPECREA